MIENLSRPLNCVTVIGNASTITMLNVAGEAFCARFLRHSACAKLVLMSKIRKTCFFKRDVRFTKRFLFTQLVVFICLGC
jgi:hypothetical protein